LRREHAIFIIPLVVSAIFIGLTTLPAYRTIDGAVYDTLLRVRPAVQEDERLVLVNINDAAIRAVGTWPWSRHVVADGILQLRNLGADRTVLDIEYIDESPRGVASHTLEHELPEAFARHFGDIRNDIEQLFGALAAEQIPVQEADDFVGSLVQRTERVHDSLLETAQEIARDNDTYLGNALSAFGPSFLTLLAYGEDQTLVPVDDDVLEYTLDRIAYQEAPPGAGVTGSGAIQPSIMPILQGARGAGFSNIVIDPDGVRRRVDVFREYDGKLFAQLGVRPTLDLLGNPQLEFRDRAVILRDAEFPGEDTARDVRIPLGADNRMLINWPPKRFLESFRQFSFLELIRLDELEENIVANLELMDGPGYLEHGEGGAQLLALYDFFSEIEREILAGETPGEEYEQVVELRDEFYSMLGRFLDSDPEADIHSYLEEVRAQTDDPDIHDEIDATMDDVDRVFSAVRDDYQAVRSHRERLRDELEDAFVIVGQTGTGTIDIGVNPFDEQYMNVGTHAAVANTILQEDFLVEQPLWISILVAILASFGLTWACRKLDPIPIIAIGVGTLVVVLGAGAGLFVGTGWYVPLFTPVGAIGLTFVSISLFNFLRTNAEKRFLRGAFSRYLSGDVISQILEDPSKLALGGEKRHMTALFTDVKGFSSISEQLDPSDLVSLLNRYLTAMSDILLERHGTIDKYEGDAIISFFGAPLTDPDHAAAACQAAIEMKRTEAELNERLRAEGLAPTQLATRIGVNTGDMVVGNMGTPQKMDYTIMGHNVNLAARLEGVNKQYGTWVLVSESTRDEAGDAFVFRPLDRVRVVGVTEPVRLYELVEEKSNLPERWRRFLDIYLTALERYEAREYAEALQHFEEAREIHPEDGPTQLYIKRCRKYAKQPPKADWDGVYNLTEK